MKELVAEEEVKELVAEEEVKVLEVEEEHKEPPRQKSEETPDPGPHPLSAAISSIGTGGQKGGTSPVNVVMNVTGAANPAAFQKSTSQISASLARAVAQGQKLF